MIPKQVIGFLCTSVAWLLAVIALSTSSWRVAITDDNGRSTSPSSYPPNVFAAASFGLREATLANITCELGRLARCFPARRSQSVYVITSEEQEAIEAATRCIFGFAIIAVLFSSL